MEIPRSTRRTRQLLLTPLIDVVFLLLLFFMITTSFAKTESMELSIPSAAAKARATSNGAVIRIYIGDNGDVFLGRNKMDIGALNDMLTDIFSKTPDRKILVLASGKVVVQDLVGVMDMVYIAGGRNISVADWKAADSVMPPPAPAAATPATLAPGGAHGV